MKKKIMIAILAIGLLFSSVLTVSADTFGNYWMNIGGDTEIDDAVAGDAFTISVSVGSHENDTYKIYIPMEYFDVTDNGQGFFTKTDDGTNWILSVDLGAAGLKGNINNISFSIQSNHQNIYDGLETEIRAEIVTETGSVIDKGKIEFIFSNPTRYDVTEFVRIWPVPSQADAVVNELLTYKLTIGSNAPQTTLKSAVITIPVPEGFVLGAAESGTLNGNFTQPGGAGQPLISNSMDIAGSLSGNIIGTFVTGVPGLVEATVSPSVSGNIVGISQTRPSSIPPMSDTLGDAVVRVVTDLKPYAMTETLMIDSSQHNFEDKLFSFFLWNESNVTLNNVIGSFTVADGYEVTGIRTPRQNVPEGAKVINRFEEGVTFVFTTYGSTNNVIETSAPLGFATNWTPTLSDSIYRVTVQISKLRAGDGTNTLISGPNAHYHANNYGANAGFLVMGESISQYRNGDPVLPGAELKVESAVESYDYSETPASVALVPGTLTQIATNVKEYYSLTRYRTSSNQLQRGQDLSINFSTFGPEVTTQWIYTNFPGVEGPVFYLVSPHHTVFKGDVVNGDFSDALTPGIGFESPEITYVKTLADGRQVIKIEYSNDPLSPHYNEVVGNRRLGSRDVWEVINFTAHYQVSNQVMYGTTTPVWGNTDTGILFYGDNQLSSYEDVQSTIDDTLDITGDGSTVDKIVAVGSHNGGRRGHEPYNNSASLKFIGPNQLSGDNAARSSLGSYTIYDPNSVLDTAVVFSEDTTLTGFYRTNLYNGLNGDVENVTQYLPLPQRDTASMTVQLTGPISAPAGTTVLYSNTLVDVQPGSLIDESTFVTESQLNNDFTTVKAVLFKIDVLSGGTGQLIELPITIAQPEKAIVGIPAVTNTYITAVNSLDSGTIYMNGISELATVYLAQSAELKVIKVDADDNDILLSGAVFRLDGPNNFTQNITTGNLGEVSLSGLEFGQYTLTEITAPHGYTLSSQPIYFDLIQEFQEITVTNEQTPVVNTGQLVLSKVDEANQKLNLAGAEFSIAGPNGYYQTAITDLSGRIVLNDLVLGTYTITEIKAPQGYLLNQTAHTVVIDTQSVELVITNQRNKGEEEIPNLGVNSPFYLIGSGMIMISMGVLFLFMVKRKESVHKK